MAARSLLRRLPSPVGFLLVAACFLLPFVTVSCGASPQGDLYRHTYTGVDLATGRVPAVTAGPGLDTAIAKSGATPAEVAYVQAVVSGSTHPTPTQPLLIVALICKAVGVLAAFVPAVWWRALSSGTAAVLALIFLAGGQVTSMRAALEQTKKDWGYLPSGNNGDAVPIATHIEYGFWLALAGLVVLAVAGGIEVVRSRQTPSTLGPPAPVGEMSGVAET
jgi:hypothetical protein